MPSSLKLVMSIALLAGVLAVGAFLLPWKLPGDLNGDGIVNIDDLKIVIAHLGTRAGQPDFDARADVNGDGVVDIADVSAELHLLDTEASRQQ